MNSDTAPREGDDRARALNAGRKMRNSIRGIDDARCERDERSKNFSMYPRCFSPGAQARLHIGKKTRRPAKIEIRVLGNTYLFKERQRQMTFDVIVDAGCIIPARTAVDDEQMAVPEGRDETTSCSSKSVMRFIASRMDPPNVARRTLLVSRGRVQHGKQRRHTDAGTQ